MKHVLFLSLSLFYMSFSAFSNEPEWTNPIALQRADPQIVLYQNVYYFIATVPEYDRIALRKADEISGLSVAVEKDIWVRPSSGDMSGYIWAPELHRIDGKWYIYYAAGNADNSTPIRMYVLENESENPMEGEWSKKGRIITDFETFCLDATTFSHSGIRYLVWAQKDPSIRGNTNLYIAEMDTPWSIKGEMVMLSKPELDWEIIGYWVNEGPSVIQCNGKVFVAYSASATDHHYCMGLLTADGDANLLDPNVWQKSPKPVFSSCEKNEIYGPGHCSFTTTKDGKQDILVYHARDYKKIEGNALANPDRHARAQFISWSPDGDLILGEPVKAGPYPRIAY
jgi:GH43 family beta-xylosidase